MNKTEYDIQYIESRIVDAASVINCLTILDPKHRGNDAIHKIKTYWNAQGLDEADFGDLSAKATVAGPYLGLSLHL